ncbi:pol polyprotein [Tanacetum coccineum]
MCKRGTAWDSRRGWGERGRAGDRRRGRVCDDDVMMEMKVVAGGCGGCGNDVGSVVLNGFVVEVIDLVVAVVGGWWPEVVAGMFFRWRCQSGGEESCSSCGSMEAFRLLVSQLCSEWFGGLLVQRVLQDQYCQRIMGVIGTQVQDPHVLLHDIHAKGITLSETFQVAAIIEKLPPSWVEFKNYLKHKRNMLRHLHNPIPKEKAKAKERMIRRAKGRLSTLLLKLEFCNKSSKGYATIMTSRVTVLLTARCRSRAIDNGAKFYMGNSATADIKGEQEFIAPYSPQQNDIAEMKNSTLKEIINAMLISACFSWDM